MQSIIKSKINDKFGDSKRNGGGGGDKKAVTDEEVLPTNDSHGY